MAKSKEVELKYKLEGQRRAKVRRRERAVRRAADKLQRVWPDDESPTGYSQHCSYIGICQHPCNGDC